MRLRGWDLGWKGEQNEREHGSVRGRRGRQSGVGGGWVPVEKYPIDKIDNGSFQRAFYESPEILVDLERSFVTQESIEEFPY